MTSNFTSGLDLAQAFYEEEIKPIIARSFPQLAYSAALIGSGSEIFGFDTETSTDHDWGPRAQIFVQDEDLASHQANLIETLGAALPSQFCGFARGFVEVTSFEKFIDNYLGVNLQNDLSAADWLSFPQQKLAAIAAGRIFYDRIGLDESRQRLGQYPHQVWLYMLASSWTRIEQEGHLMGRAGMVGDEIGSALIGARLVRDIMQLCFLMEKCYAPYPKWFGTAFQKLPCAPLFRQSLQMALSSDNWLIREEHLSNAYEQLAKMHNALQITAPLQEKVREFHDRPYKVISTGEFSEAIIGMIGQEDLKMLATKPRIGSIDHLSDSTDLLTNVCWRQTVKNFY